MRVLVVVESPGDVNPMNVLLHKAGIEGYALSVLPHKPTHKPTIKVLRAVSRPFSFRGDYDYIIASGETAARFVLNTNIVNLNRLRGRDFEYKP